MKKTWIRLALAAMTLAPAAATLISPVAYSQSTTAGDISGTITDATGAAIVKATVTATNVATGVSKTTTTSASGAYRISLLAPGTYKVTADASGFALSENLESVFAGSIATDDLKLQVGQNSTTIEVTAAPPMLNTENGDISTTLTSEEVQAMPNPGNDLTFVAQIAPGSVMNTGGSSGDGYGNFSSFGISALSNMFTLDGGYENDPFLNLNNTGASNLTLGNNEVDTVTVVAPAFSAQFGGLGGAQVSEITASGGNRVHGNASYYWNGRVMNANEWFIKQSQVFNGEKNQAGSVNANQWAASIGGPIYRNRLFWFVNTEGLRVTVPNSGQVYAPSPAFQACSLNGTGCAALNAAADAICANGGNCTGGQNGVSPFAQAPANQRALLTTIYNVYNNSPFRPKTGVTADTQDASAVTYFAQAANFLPEWLLTGRIDYKISDKDSIYVHYKQDHGIQPTYTDFVDPRFSTQSNQPAWEGQLNETHNFSPNIVNQLVVAGNYYVAAFQNSNNYLPVAPFTAIFETGDLANTAYGGENYFFPQGRRVAGYQVIDDLSWTRGKNTLRFGYNFRRDNITDLPQVRSIATEELLSTEAFGQGQVDYEHVQYFPTRLEQPIALYNEGFYAQDTLKLSRTLTITAGLRIEHTSNPTCLTNCFATLAGDITTLPTGTASAAAPYSAAFAGGLISANRHQTFKGFQSVGIMPRVSFAWQPFGEGKSVLRGGFGMFTDSPPGSIADTLLSNAPGNFHGIVLGSQLGPAGTNNLALTPGTTTSQALGGGTTLNASGATIATQSASAFTSQFAKGGTYTSTAAAVVAAGGSYSTPSFTTTTGNIKYPTYEEWSLAFEHQLDKVSTIAVQYVGNHGYHEPVLNAGYNLSTAGHSATFFPTVPSAKPVTAFATVSNIYTGASSNYNGLVVTATRHSKQFTVQFNYQYAKALDEVSNGGLEPFAGDAGDANSVENPLNLHQQYGRADYDVRHNVSGIINWQVPSYHRLRALTGGFEFNSVLFHNSGIPYSILQSTSSISAPTIAKPTATATFANGTSMLLARQLSNNFDRHCGGGNHALLPDGSGKACNFTSAFGAPTNFGQQGRNSVNGPSYTDVNFGAFKQIPIYKLESVKLKVGAQFFNLFNHPNFQNPTHSLSASGNSQYGLISSTVGAPTSIFGSTGAASSPRLVQLTGKITF